MSKSFHIHDPELPYFQGLPQYQGVYDGHSTQEKWARVLNFNPKSHISSFVEEKLNDYL